MNASNVPRHELIQPVETNHQHTVESTFAFPNPYTGQTPYDNNSVNRFTEYLDRRFMPDAEIIPGQRIRLPDGVEHITAIEHTGWFFWGAGDARRFWTAVGCANLLLNGGLNAGLVGSVVKDSVEIAQSVKDRVEDHYKIGWHINPGKTITKTVEKPGITKVGTFIAPAHVGSVEPNVDDVRALVNQIQGIKNKANQIQKIEITANSSDDWRSKLNSGLGEANSENYDLAKKRKEAFTPVLQDEATKLGLDLTGVDITFQEKVLTPEELRTIEIAVQKYGFNTIDAALANFNTQPDLVPAGLYEVLDTYFGKYRGESASVTYKERPYTVTTQEPGKPFLENDGKPRNDKHNYHTRLIPLLLVPLPTFRKRKEERIRQCWLDLPPTMPDPEYLKLYPEAVNDNNELVKNSWIYARKYQNLLRESDRIQGSYRLDYVDTNGEAQRLRAIFVDHEPSEVTREMIAGMFKKISQMQGGRVGKELDMLVVYPTKNTGTKHATPKRVGLGIDIQQESNIMGIAYPNIGLVEMHMSPDATGKDLQGFNSAEWTLAHEIAGHFTDLNDSKNGLSKLATLGGIPIYLTNNRFEDIAKKDYDHVTAQEQGRDIRTLWQKIIRKPFTNGLLWRIRRGTQMVSGNIEQRDEVVVTTDPRLSEATFVRNERFTSRYGRSDAAEHYAEAAAQVATGSSVPFSEEPDTIRSRFIARLGYADGYATSTSMHKLIAERWGSDTNVDNLVFKNEQETANSWKEWYGRLDQDAELTMLANQARLQPLPKEEDLIHIITGTRIKK